VGISPSHEPTAADIRLIDRLVPHDLAVSEAHSVIVRFRRTRMFAPIADMKRSSLRSGLVRENASSPDEVRNRRGRLPWRAKDQVAMCRPILPAASRGR
jgi:hypothetical protein